MFGFRADPVVDELASVPAFASCTRAELGALAARSTIIDVPAGRSLCREGDVGHELFVVLAGSVEIHVDGELAAEVGAGEILGEIAVMTDARRNADAVVANPAAVLVMSRREFSGLASAHPKFARIFMSAMAGRARVPSS